MGLPLARPLLGTWPITQACALTGNLTGYPLVCRTAPSPLSHTSQGIFISILILGNFYGPIFNFANSFFCCKNILLSDVFFILVTVLLSLEDPLKIICLLFLYSLFSNILSYLPLYGFL